MSHEITSESREKLKTSTPFDVVFARHADYQKEGDGAEEETIGKLTKKGVAQAKRLGEEVFERAVETERPVDVLFISSPTAYEDSSGKSFGHRADHTADVAMEQILELAEKVPADIQLLGQVPIQYPETPYHSRLAEPNIHYVEGAADPREYFESQIEKFGKKGQKEGYARGDSEIDAVAKQIGAETAEDVGDRAFSVVEDMKHLAELHAQHHPDRDFMVVLVTHDDVMRSIVQNNMGAGEEAHNYFPENAEILPLHVEGDTVQLKFKGKVYTKSID